MSDEDWGNGFAKSLAVFLNGDEFRLPIGMDGGRGYSFYLIFNAHWEAVNFTLPAEIGGRAGIAGARHQDGAARRRHSGPGCARAASSYRITFARSDEPCCVNRDPLSTYRIQLNSQFGFERRQELIPYLEELGIDYLYCSPSFRRLREALMATMSSIIRRSTAN